MPLTSHTGHMNHTLLASVIQQSQRSKLLSGRQAKRAEMGLCSKAAVGSTVSTLLA